MVLAAPLLLLSLANTLKINTTLKLNITFT